MVETITYHLSAGTCHVIGSDECKEKHDVNCQILMRIRVGTNKKMFEKTYIHTTTLMVIWINVIG